MADTPAIEVKELSKIYTPKKGKPKTALDAVDLVIPRGSFFGLLGPNGAGKSTFINILAGLTVKTSGSASICGHSIDTDRRNASKALGVVPQELVLDPFFPVRDALEFTAGYYGIPKSQRRSDEIIDAVGLTDKANAPARSLSGGMRRRLLVAKALVHNPQVLILDEPTAGVDVELRTQLWEYVKKLNEQGTTIVLTTHYLEEAEELCDYIAVIDHGKIIANDSKRAMMKVLDQKTIRILLQKPIDTIPSALQTFDATLSEPDVIEINYHTREVSMNEILSACANSSLNIQDLSTEEPDLEQVFRYLTRQTG